MRMSADLERMGDLARHVAKVARLRYPQSAIPAEARATVLQMGQVAERIVAKAGSVIAGKDVETAVTLERDDDEMDRLHRELFNMLLDDTWNHGIEAAVDVTLRRPLLRALRRPRGVGRPARGLPGHRRVAHRGASSTARSDPLTGRTGRPTGPSRVGFGARCVVGVVRRHGVRRAHGVRGGSVGVEALEGPANALDLGPGPPLQPLLQRLALGGHRLGDDRPRRWP